MSVQMYDDISTEELADGLVLQSGLDDTLLVELGGYVGMPETAEASIQEITGTFTCVN